MTEDEIKEAYLSNFPTVFQDALHKDNRMKNKFFRTVLQDYEDIKVYRAINFEDKVVEDDFLSYVEIANKKDENIRKSLEVYSVSVNEDREQLIRCLDIPNEERKLLGIAVGTMKCKYGPADFKNQKTHHNWYLYKDVIPLIKEEFVAEKINNNEKRDNSIMEFIYNDVEKYYG